MDWGSLTQKSMIVPVHFFRVEEWQVTIVSPGLAAQDLQSLHLSDSQGILLERICPL
jgi:hypothetical protein